MNLPVDAKLSQTGRHILRYKRQFIAALDFGLISTMRPDASWLQDVADILADVYKDVGTKAEFFGIGWRPNGFVLTTARSTDEDFYGICVQMAGISSRFLSLGLPVSGAVALGDLFQQRQGDARVQFGPAAAKINDLLALNSRPRIIFDTGITIRGLEKPIPTDDDGWSYLDVFDPGFLSDYWALHHRYLTATALPRLDIVRTKTLIAQVEMEAPAGTQPLFLWLSKFIERVR